MVNSPLTPMRQFSRQFSGRMRPGRKPASNPFSKWGVCSVSCVCIGLIWFTYHGVSYTAFVKPPRAELEDNNDPFLTMPLTPPTQPSAKELIAAIRETTLLAAGGVDFYALTNDERRQWDVAHPCRSRLSLKSVYERRKYASDVEDNLVWESILEEYAKLHRTCRERVGNVKEYFLAGNTSIAGCKFAIADYSEAGGLGNKILAITNTVLYSILTQRVVLVPSYTLVPALMCEPFPGSSWLLEDGLGDEGFSIPPWDAENIQSWAYHDQVYQDLDVVKRTSRGKDSKTTSPAKVYASAMGRWHYQPESRFYCDAEQASFSGVTWLYFTGCLYIIPRFFSVPSWRPTLEALFPDRMVLTHLVRSIMLPEDLVWDRIFGSYNTHLATADRRVGVQIRYRRNLEEYNQMNTIINDRVMKCAIDNGVLPQTGDKNGTFRKLIERPTIKLLIASLFTGFQDMLTETYLPYPTATGEEVDVVQLTSNTKQSYGLEVDRESLVEIFLLSFSDELFVTPLSTFGGLAQAYGNIHPWIIDYRLGEHFGPCQIAQTVDLCYQEAQFSYSCRYDPDVDGKTISEVVPYIANCLPGDSQPGIQSGFQLITANPPKRKDQASSWKDQD